VSFLEWVDPLYCGGHWIPQMLNWAGADDRNSRSGTDSVRIPWEDVLQHQPEVILVSPCGFKTHDALRQAALLQSRPGWHELPAVKNRRVYAVDANAYFARPGPRLVDGVELLAHLIHPEHFSWSGPHDAYCIAPISDNGINAICSPGSKAPSDQRARDGRLPGMAAPTLDTQGREH
jgi:iron complex transport system substrate-binding protein